MRILHFLSHFSLLSETFVYDEIHALERTFPNSNTVLTFERHLAKERPFPRVMVLNKIPSFSQNLHRRYLKYLKGSKIPREFFPLCSYLDKHLDSFDLLQVHFAWNAPTLWQALKFLDREKAKPILVRCQGSDITSNPRLDPQYRRQLLELAAADNVLFAPNSEFLALKMIQLGIARAKIEVVPNSFNSSFLTHHKRHFFKRGDCLKLINTARFIEWKGQDFLVRAFARFVREVYENSELTLIGEGETRPLVQRIAEEEGIAGKVRFLGGVPHGEIAHHLVRSDFYIQPSIIDAHTFQEESFGVVLLEALAVGLPLVITRTGGMPEIVGEDNAFARIVPDRDAAALFRALKEMFETGTCFQDISAHAQLRLKAFAPERQMQQLQSVYSKVLRKTSRCLAA